MSEAKQVGSGESNGTMVTHYGLFWSERAVFWGRQGVNTEKTGLLGQVVQKKGKGNRGASTNEQRENQRDNFSDYIGLYCLYSGYEELLYIGQTGLGTDFTLFKRLKNHRKDFMANRWDRFSWFGRKALKDQASQANIEGNLRQLEAITIAITNPSFNKKSGTFTNALEVFQVPNEEAEGDLDMKLSRITEQINSIKNSIKSN